MKFMKFIANKKKMLILFLSRISTNIDDLQTVHQDRMGQYMARRSQRSNSQFQRPHKVKKNISYRLWNPVSKQNDGFIERDPETNIVNCKGSINSGINSMYFNAMAS